MKRILLVSPMPPLIGGISVSSKRLYDRLKTDGYDVSYYNVKFEDERLNCKILLILKFFILPFYILFRKRYDVIHCHVSGTVRRLYIVLMRFCYKRAKLIFTVHGDISPCLKSKSCMYALGKADRIICVQQGDAARLPVEIRSKAVDIPAFIMPTEMSEEHVPESVMNFVKETKVPVILFNGALVLSDTCYDLYGFQDVLAVFYRLRQAGIKVRLLMVVNGSIDNGVRKEFIDSIRHKVEGDSDVMLVTKMNFPFVPLYPYGAVYVRPTKTDGDSLSIREALAMGCPVVASDASWRPSECLVYHTFDIDDFFDKVYTVLKFPDSVKPVSVDFYTNIVAQY